MAKFVGLYLLNGRELLKYHLKAHKKCFLMMYFYCIYTGVKIKFQNWGG